MRCHCLPVAILLSTLVLGACGDKDDNPDDTAPPEGDTDTDTDADGDTDADTDTDTDTDTDLARWTFMVFMNGDNDLEAWVPQDLNELERAGSGDGVHIVVQADRAEGYSTADGDWTETRRYYIEQDSDDTTVVSEIVQDMGELDMGDPGTLSQFLLWANDNYPAEHVAVIMWDHGEGWMLTDGTPPLPGVSWDDSSRNDMSVAEGELQEGLQPLVDARGPIDVLGFDACNMAAWEVAHAFADQADYVVGSESTVGMGGYQYDLTLATLRERPGWTPADLATDLANQAVEGGEWTQSAFDSALVPALSTAIDGLAQAALADETVMEALLEARDASRGTDHTYNEWYMDIGDLARNIQDSSNPRLAAYGADIEAALDDAVIANYTGGPYAWATGLNILFDARWMSHLRDYQNGAGATWSQDTHWDDLLMAVAEQ